MKKSQLIEKIRVFLRDTNGKIWSDQELSSFFDNAADAYSADTECFRSQFFFCVNADGICKLPENYLKFLAAWNDNGQKILSISVREIQRFLPDYTSVKGRPDFLYEEMDRIGTIRFSPNPYERQKVAEYSVAGYGIPDHAKTYGIPDHGRSYGIPSSIRIFQKAGDLIYIRRENAENIRDYMALIYHALYQAYNNDSDFHDAEKAEFYKTQYQRRIARFGQMKPANISIRKHRKFY